MSKNLTLKGAAFGALVALGSTVIAGTPANAALPLETVLNSGVSFNSVTGYSNDLTVKTLISSANSADDDDLSYRITNAGGATLQINAGVGNVSSVVDGTAILLKDYATTTSITTDADSGTSNTQTADTDFVVTLGSTPQGDYTGSNLLSIGVKDATTTDYTVKVQAWLDVNNDNEINGTELSGSEVTLKFYDEKNVTASAVVTAPVVGADNVVAKITTSPELNGAQLGAEFITGKWTTQGNSNAVSAANTFKIASKAKTDGSTVWDATDKVWKSTVYLPFALKATPWSGNAVTFNTIDLDAATAATYTTTASVATIVKASHGVADYAAVQVAATAADDAGAAGDESDLADELDGYFATGDNTTSNVLLSGAFTTGSSDTLEDTSTLDVIGFKGAYTTVQAAGQYTVEAYLGSDKLATAGLAAATPKAGANPVISAVTTENVKGSADSYTVRSGYKTVSIKAPVLTSASKSVGAGVEATVRVAKNGSLSTATDKVTSITVGGKTLTNTTTDGYVEFTTTTNADGNVAFDITSSTGADEDTLDITVSVAGPYSDTMQITWEDAVIPNTGLVDVAASAANTPVRTVVKGSTHSIQYALVDDFGKLVTDAGYRVAVTVANTLGATYTYQQAFSGGYATVSIKDDSTSTGSHVITGTVQAYDKSSGNYATTLAGSLLTSGETVTSTVYVTAAARVASALTATATATSSGVVSLKDWKTGDTRISTFVDPAYGSGYFTIAGTVTDVYGIAIPGAEVTVKATDVAFSTGSVFTTGSITLLANASGEYSVVAYGHKAAVTTFTASSGTATKTVDATFTSTLTLSDTSVFKISALEKINAGRTVSVKFSVTDRWGNPILLDASAGTRQDLITVSYDGPGYLSATAPTVFVDDTGAASLLLITGPEDLGIGKFTLSNKGVDGANTTDAEKADDVKITKTMLIGVSASVSAGKKLASAVVKNAAGATVKVVSGTKSVTKVATSDSYKVSLTKLTAGKKTVKVYVEGILVLSKSVTVKK